MTVEWDCEGCGAHVLAFGIEKIPRHQFCSVCAWACEFLDPSNPEWDAVTRSRAIVDHADVWAQLGG